ncbi:MAG TPA: adenylate/guanylate cyclase domain-containing protein [Candidatus Acidoferrum sp.]|nr:adenylate/guanylate cyclase domain-containing protein [Candidatus Acidoferrum sp.]
MSTPEPAPLTAPAPDVPWRRPRLWQRLDVRLAALFALVTLLAVGLVGTFVYQRQRREVEDMVGTQLLNIARTAALLVDPATHAELQRASGVESPAYARVQRALAAVQSETVLTTPIYTLADYDPERRRARVVVTSGDDQRAGQLYAIAPAVVEPLGWTLEDGVARYTRVYGNGKGRWITAFAPIVLAGKNIAVLVVDYPVEIFLDRSRELAMTILQGTLAGGLGALVLGLLFARRITRPVSALTRGVARVAGGDLSQSLPVRSSDEIGQLTRAFNGMVEGLRQRDFIRNTFGRYVSPEVVKTLLESPEGLRFGGEKRVVTILMSDLRGYTRFAEHGDPADVMNVLNGYLARMTDIVVAHGGTINEFIGDAIFAIFGAPLAHPDHAERAAATALAMQRAMVEINADHVARGLPPFEMGIGINTGEAVVGNIGSEQRAKYAVVGSVVNVAGRVEGATVGGQIFVTASTHAALVALAEVAPPVSLELKGLSEPLLLYELRGIGGRFAQRLEDESEDGVDVPVELPLVGAVVEGKVVGPDAIRGVVVRLGRRRVDARLSTSLAPLTNVRLTLTYPALGRDSGDLYGKVVSGAPETLTRVWLTSVEAADEGVFAAFLADPAATGR